MKDQLKEALAAIKNGEEERARIVLAQMLKEEPDSTAGWILLSKLAQTEVQKVAFLHKVLALDPTNEYATVELALLEGEEEVEERTEPVVAATEAAPAAAETADMETADMETADMKTVEAEAVGPAGESEVVVVETETEATPPEPVPVPEPDSVPVEAEADEEEPIAAPATELPARVFDAEEEEEEEGAVTVYEQAPASEESFDFDVEAEAETLPPWLADDDELAQEPTAEVATPPPAELPDWLEEEPEAEWRQEEPEEEITPATPVVERVEKEKRAPKAAASVRPKPQPAAERSSVMSLAVIGLGILLVVIFLVLIYAVLVLI